MVNKIIEITIALLFIFIVLLLITDSLISNNNYADELLSNEEMLAIANDIKRAEAKIEKTDTNEEVEATNVSNEVSTENNETTPTTSTHNIEEIAAKIDKEFNNELKGKGYLYASYSISKGVDPYLAAAISLEETGCKWNCSSLVKNCNNVGGMKGSGCGEYGYFPDLDTGIKAFIDNIHRNYVLYGLTTADTMNPKYAENPLWARNVNAYIERIKNN